MCGICGIAGGDPRQPPVGPEALRAMTDAIVHRGPDEEGAWIGPGVALGVRRLGVIDVGGSHQPILSEDGAVTAIFNGEIYNYRLLRDNLRARGHRLATDGDGEVIVHLYEEHGLDFVRHLRGMFGIAVWDERRRRLVLARDRLGVKPLYYASTPDGGLAFASEVKALIAGGLVQPRLDPLGAELFLAHGFVPGPHTLFQGVRKLPPATVLVFEDGRVVQESEYWTPWDQPSDRAGLSWEDDQERLLELLRASVRGRMIADVPLGVMLSGGLDSSLLTALMAEVSSSPVETFSIGFEEDAGSDELAVAATVAERLGARHHAIRTSAADHPGLLDEVLWHMEEPVADISQLGFMLLCRLARRHVTVALSGQGADELLGGYRKHEVAAAATIAQRLPGPLRAALLGLGRAAPDGSALQRGLLAVGTQDPVQRLLAMSRVLQAGERARLLSPDFMVPGAEAEIAAVVRANLAPVPQTPLGQTLHLDRRLALVDNMLLYFDKVSMAASLEVRVPFLDQDVVGFCCQLADSRRVWRGRRKELLKRASRGLVDDAIIDAPKRGFFHSALGAWLSVHRDELIRSTLLEGPALERGIYQERVVRDMVRRAGAQDKKAAQRLFSLVLLERWQRIFLDGEGASAPGRDDSLAA